MTKHATANNETLSIKQITILERYLADLPNWIHPRFKRRYEQMARELTALGYSWGYSEGWRGGYDDGYCLGRDDGWAARDSNA